MEVVEEITKIVKDEENNVERHDGEEEEVEEKGCQEEETRFDVSIQKGMVPATLGLGFSLVRLASKVIKSKFEGFSCQAASVDKPSSILLGTHPHFAVI